MLKNEFFSYQSNFSFFRGCPKFPFFTTWRKKRAPKKYYKNRGFSKDISKKRYASRNGLFWTKNQNPEIPVVIFGGGLFFFSVNNKNTKHCWNPIFRVFRPHKKENFQKNLKQRKLKNPILHLFWKRLFLENCQTIGHKKQHTRW